MVQNKLEGAVKVRKIWVKISTWEKSVLLYRNTYLWVLTEDIIWKWS